MARAVKEGADAERLRGIKGLCFKDQGKPVVNQEREPVMDLDSLPMPARHLFASHRYTYPNAKSLPIFPIFTSRGCPGKCTFCGQQKISGRRLRVRSAAKVADEMELSDLKIRRAGNPYPG